MPNYTHNVTMIEFFLFGGICMSFVSDEVTIRELESKKVWEYENGFYWFSHPSRLGKMLAHYELYRRIVGLPGEILEFGVYKGASLIRFATFRNLLENSYSRKIVGFDAFGEFPRESINLQTDLDFISSFESAGGDGLDVSEVEQIVNLKKFDNVNLIKGNILQTLPNFLEKNSALRISLLHLDMDVKEPTEYVLKQLFSRMVPGGIIVLDDYGTVQGESLAIDEFVKANNLKIEKLSNSYAPSFVRC